MAELKQHSQAIGSRCPETGLLAHSDRGSQYANVRSDVDVFTLGLLAHSDRGSQYASEQYQPQLAQHGIRCIAQSKATIHVGTYQRQLAQHGIRCRMSRRGHCWDNAPMESFFASRKKELAHRERYQTVAEAKASLFEFIAVFYKRERHHSSWGMWPPRSLKVANTPHSPSVFHGEVQ